MGAAWLVLGSAFVFALAYRFYGNYISSRVFKADDSGPVPSVELNDGIDYVPTNKEVLFGHHFASIAGTGPIVGPAIAVIWGWVPAVIWIVFGAIFAGAVHDYASVIISVREKGASIGKLSGEVLSKRVKVLFSSVILFVLWIVVAIFGMIIAVIFRMYPQAVLPVWAQLPIAICVGYLAYRKRFNMFVMSVAAVILLYLSILLGVRFPFVMPSLLGLSPMAVWMIILFVYAFIASVLPVWALLQPRDYVNSHQLIVGIALITAGVFFARPEMVAPAVRLYPEGAPPILPFLFITVACGAISGFHSLIGSGTSSKQLKSERDAKMVGFGGMLTEAFLAILVVVAVSAGIGLFVRTPGGEVLSGLAAWEHHYSSWAAADGLTNKVAAFVNGAANMMRSLGIPLRYGQAVVGVLIASFAGTTLDTATRIQRYIISEFGVSSGIRPLENRYIATSVAIIAAAALAFGQGDGKGALALWPLFGSSNQLLAGLALLVASVYLIKRRAPYGTCFVPMVFMILSSAWAMTLGVKDFFLTRQLHLMVIGGIILSLQLWMVLEAYFCIKKGSFPDRARP